MIAIAFRMISNAARAAELIRRFEAGDESVRQSLSLLLLGLATTATHLREQLEQRSSSR
jgi:hypothetical protein